jgi:uncharacterized Zn finger protein (UPF0148 family)
MFFQKECPTCATLKEIIRDERAQNALLMRMILETAAESRATISDQVPSSMSGNTDPIEWQNVMKQSGTVSARRTALELQSLAKQKDIENSDREDKTITIEELETAFDK